jgi:thioredoxin-dependent peroxiredoxin
MNTETMVNHDIRLMKSNRSMPGSVLLGIALLDFLFAVSMPLQLQAASADFTVQSPADGKTFKLSEAKGKYVALHFLLKTECPFCLKHTRDYAKKAVATPDVFHVFLKPDSADEIKGWGSKASRGDDFPDVTIYRDSDANLAKQFGIPGGYQFHGQTVHYPALVLLDPSGIEVFRYVGKSNVDRFSYEKFALKLAELKEKPAAIQHYNLGADKVALKGYDPVSYFTSSQALNGRKEISAQHRGITYWFASNDNKELFVASPEKYRPTYGGWCATAMAKGEKVEIDPTNFKVTNGRLFVFFKAFYANARKDWNKDEANLTTKADANWRRISGE